MIKSRLKSIMHEKGFTVRSLAAAAFVAKGSVENARTDAGIAECRLSTLKRIADCLEVPISALYEDTDDSTKNVDPRG